MAHQAHSFTLDTAYRSINAVTISSTGTTNGTAIDLGAANQYAKFAVVIDWSGLTVAGSNNETYRFKVQLSDSSGFSTQAVTCEKILGDKDATANTHDTPAAGRAVLFADNVATFSSTDPNTVAACRYVRVQCVAGGTSPAATISAHIVPLP